MQDIERVVIYPLIFYITISFVWWLWLSATVVSAGYHRYFAHKSFKAPLWYKFYVLILGPLSGSGPVLSWVGVHRMHHAHSDTPHDPHSPKFKGIVAVLTSTFKVKSIPRKYIRDLLRDPHVVWFYKNSKVSLFLVYFFGILLFPLPWFFALFIAPWIYGHVGYGLINYLCHKDGVPRNSPLANILTGGEGWHENHHNDSSNYRIGKKWWQIDTGAMWIKLIRK